MRFLCINTTDKSPHNVLSQMILEERRARTDGKSAKSEDCYLRYEGLKKHAV